MFTVSYLKPTIPFKYSHLLVNLSLQMKEKFNRSNFYSINKYRFSTEMIPKIHTRYFV